MTGRTYSEREVAQIIERAVERQEEARRAAPETGLSIDELERVGREVGIDPAHLREAAAELDAGGGHGRSSTQTKTHVVVERWLPGPLSVEAWEDAVAELQQRVGLDAGTWYGREAGGSLSQVGTTYEWTHTSQLGVQTRVTVSARGDRTRLRLSQLVGVARSAVEGPLWGGVLTLLLWLLPAANLFEGQPALFAASTVAVFVLLSALVFYLDRQWRAKKLEQLGALADELSRRLVAPEAGGTGRDVEAAALAPVPPARLALLDEEPEGDPEGERVRRRTRS
jgi:hypothetical protein